MTPLIRIITASVVVCCCFNAARSQPPSVAKSDPMPSTLDFREHAAPPEIRVLASPELRECLKLDHDQQNRLDLVLRKWEAEYRKRKAEIDALPAENIRDRRGWPPTRDRNLQARISNVLTADQQKLFERVTSIWNLGPVRSADGFRYDTVLQLSQKQHRELHALDVRWVLFALPDVDDIDDGTRSEFYRAVAPAGWEFQPQRDVAWRKILTGEQASTWQQQELRMWLQIDPFILLNDFSGRQPEEVPRTETFTNYLIPYFEPPAVVLNWTEFQKADIQAMLAEMSAVKSEEIRQSADRDARRAAFLAATQRWNRTLKGIEVLMTETQKKPGTGWSENRGWASRPRSLVNDWPILDRHNARRINKL